MQIPGIVCSEEPLNEPALNSKQVEAFSGLLSEDVGEGEKKGSRSRAAIIERFAQSVSDIGRDYKDNSTTRRALYQQLFDGLVKVINKAVTKSGGTTRRNTSEDSPEGRLLAKTGRGLDKTQLKLMFKTPLATFRNNLAKGHAPSYSPTTVVKFGIGHYKNQFMAYPKAQCVLKRGFAQAQEIGVQSKGFHTIQKFIRTMISYTKTVCTLDTKKWTSTKSSVQCLIL